MPMVPNMDLYLPLAGFLLSLVFLLYSLASYREALLRAAEPVMATEPAAQPAADDSSSIEEISAEIAAFKQKIQEMHEVVALRKNLHEKQIGDIISGINGIVGRLEQADPQKVAVLQPHIAKLVSELQELRAPAPPSGEGSPQ